MGIFLLEMRHLLVRLGIGRRGGWGTILVHIALVGAFGIFLPWRKGFDFLDAFLILAYAAISVLFAAPATAQAMRPRHAL